MKAIIIILLVLSLCSCATIPFNDCNESRCYIAGIPDLIGDNFATCGPTALAMVLNHYGDKIKAYKIADQVQKKGNLSTTVDMLAFLKNRGYKYNFFAYRNFSYAILKENIRNGRPILTVGKWPGYKDYHMVVVVGYDEGGIYYKDPIYHGVKKALNREVEYIMDSRSWILVIYRKGGI